MRLAGQLSQPFSTSLALYYAAVVHRERGEHAAAVANAEAALDAARAHGLQTDRLALLVRLSLEGALEESELARLHQSARPPSSRWSNVFAFCLLAEAYARAGVPDRGLAALAEIPEDSPETVYSSEIHRCRGELLLSQGQAHGPEAENCFRTALDLARRGARRSLELRAASSLGRLLQRQGKREDARHLVAEIYFGFTEGFDTADLRDAKMLLDELSTASSEIR